MACYRMTLPLPCLSALVVYISIIFKYTICIVHRKLTTLITSLSKKELAICHFNLPLQLRLYLLAVILCHTICEYEVIQLPSLFQVIYI
jgi:hypothetical protein